MKHSCRNCHFLSTSYIVNDSSRQERFASWGSEARQLGNIDYLHDFGMEVNACCQKGVWHTGHDVSTFDFLGTVSPVGKEDIRSKLKDELDQNRKDDCFFVEYSEGMSFDGAFELYRIRNENRNLKRSLNYAVKGLYISGAAALLNFFGIDNVSRFFELIFKTLAKWLNM